MTTSTYSPTYLPSAYGQQGPYQQGPHWQQQQQQPGQFGWTGSEQFNPWQQSGGQQQFGGQSVDQTIQLIVQLLGTAQQQVTTAQHIVAQLLPQMTGQHQQQFGQQRQFQRPYSMTW